MLDVLRSTRETHKPGRQAWWPHYVRLLLRTKRALKSHFGLKGKCLYYDTSSANNVRELREEHGCFLRPCGLCASAGFIARAEGAIPYEIFLLRGLVACF